MHDPYLHLFVDDTEIDHSKNLERVLNRLRRHPEPVLDASLHIEGGRSQAWGSVIRESDGLFRMWYIGMPRSNFGELHCCYAESDNGVNWRKPSLGLEAWQKNCDNNIFYGFGDADTWELARRGEGIPARDMDGNVIGVLNNMDGLTVVRDESEIDPDKRYKLIANMQDHRMWAQSYRDHYPDVTDEQIREARSVWGQYIDTSPDGLHWTKEPRMLVTAEHGDYMMVMRDERNSRWLLNQRPASNTGRAAGLRTSHDIESWPDTVNTIFENGPDSDSGRKWEWHGGFTPFNYGNMDLGFLERWTNTGSGDYCELVSHRDNEEWQRVAPGKPFLDVGHEGAWDRCLAYPSHNPPIQVGNELYIYYTGFGYGTGVTGGDLRYTAAIGLMTLSLDRFAGMANARGPAGQLVTTPIAVSGDTLQINVEQGVFTNGTRVALKRPDLSDIGGFSLDDCDPVINDSVRSTVSWNGASDISHLQGQQVVLEFEVKGMTLYAFRFGATTERDTINE